MTVVQQIIPYIGFFTILASIIGVTWVISGRIARVETNQDHMKESINDLKEDIKALKSELKDTQKTLIMLDTLKQYLQSKSDK